MKSNRWVIVLGCLSLFGPTMPSFAADLPLSGNLNGNYYYADGNIVSQGTCTIQSGANVKISGFGELTLNPGFETMANSTLYADINNQDDTDNDGLPDWWEYAFFGNLSKGGNEDSDGDQLTNKQEYALRSKPTVNNPDTDGDSLPDWWELQYFGNLNQGRNDDADGDGVSNYDEYLAGNNPNLPVPPTVTFLAGATVIEIGQSVNLTWNTTAASMVSITPGVTATSLSGTTSVSPTAPTTYILSATGSGGTTLKEVFVNVRNGYNAAGKFTVNGKVGVGVLNPEQVLEVKGVMKSRGLQLEANDWPDYVFDDQYRLRSLKNVAEYIKENKHLPDMPAAAELTRQGVALSEMLTKQMQKIEELALYIIQLRKQNEDLQSRIKVLEKKEQ